MSPLTRPFSDARSFLDVPRDADRKTIARAYRRKVIQHSPDRDPEGFRLLREYYELLTAPLPRVRERLSNPDAFIDAQALPGVPHEAERLVENLLRIIVASLPSAELMDTTVPVAMGDQGSHP